MLLDEIPGTLNHPLLQSEWQWLEHASWICCMIFILFFSEHKFVDIEINLYWHVDMQKVPTKRLSSFSHLRSCLFSILSVSLSHVYSLPFSHLLLLLIKWFISMCRWIHTFSLVRQLDKSKTNIGFVSLKDTTHVSWKLFLCGMQVANLSK